MAYLRELWLREVHKGKLSLVMWMVSPVLYPLSLLYRLVFQVKRNLKRPKKIPIKSIVVGNLTLGGNGKTPLVTKITKILQGRGLKTAIAVSGYKSGVAKSLIVDDEHSARMVGDEAKLHSKYSTVVVGKNRVESVELLRDHDVDVLIFDDGFQSAQISFDVSIIVVGERAFGNNHFIPFGPLRQSPKILSSTTVTILHHSLRGSTLGDERLYYEPIFSSFVKGGVRVAVDVVVREVTDCLVLTLASIANPESFFRIVKDLGIVSEFKIFSDHHQFSENEISDFKMFDYLICTEKDSVKLLEFPEIEHRVIYLEYRLEVYGLEEFLERSLDLGEKV